MFFCSYIGEDKENQPSVLFVKEKRTIVHKPEQTAPLPHQKKKKIEIVDNSSEEHRSGTEYSEERSECPISESSSSFSGAPPKEAPSSSSVISKKRNPVLSEVENVGGI